MSLYLSRETMIDKRAQNSHRVAIFRNDRYIASDCTYLFGFRTRVKENRLRRNDEWRSQWTAVRLRTSTETVLVRAKCSPSKAVGYNDVRYDDRDGDDRNIDVNLHDNRRSEFFTWTNQTGRRQTSVIWYALSGDTTTVSRRRYHGRSATSGNRRIPKHRHPASHGYYQTDPWPPPAVQRTAFLTRPSEYWSASW